MGIYFEEYGDKDAQTIVFIHGGGIGGWMWKKQVEHFKDYHCIVPDLPGQGNSRDMDIAALDECADLVGELIETKANNRKAHVVGHSLGAKVLVSLLVRNPELIDHAVAASGLYRHTILGIFFNRFVYKATVAMNRSELLLRIQAKQFDFPDAWYTENFIKDMRSLTIDKLEKIYDELYKNLKIPEGLSDIKVPVLVTAGGLELRSMKESVKDLVNTIPNSRGIIIKPGLHTYPWAFSGVFNEIIRDWISGREVISCYIKTIK